jgi:hypothetical protein
VARALTQVRSADADDVAAPAGASDSAAVWVGAALEAALDVRTPGGNASTPMVRQLALKVSRYLSLDAQSTALLDLAVRVRDVGMLALPDEVVHATAPLSPADWELVNRHPVIGAELLEQLSVVAPAAQIVRSHHERWDGGGYPDGSSGEAIPLLSRVIATCDAFVAIASDRPYRRGSGAAIALEHVSRESGSQFDPRMVGALVAVLAPDTGRTLAPRGETVGDVVAKKGPRVAGQKGHRLLTNALAELDVIPAFAPASEQALVLTEADAVLRGELVGAIESDTGLTIAVLRRAQSAAGWREIANLPDAVAALSSEPSRWPGFRGGRPRSKRFCRAPARTLKPSRAPRTGCHEPWRLSSATICSSPRSCTTSGSSCFAGPSPNMPVREKERQPRRNARAMSAELGGWITRASEVYCSAGGGFQSGLRTRLRHITAPRPIAKWRPT